MSKKSFSITDTYREELINSIEPNFEFEQKPLKRFKFGKVNNASNNLDKIKQINELKKLINSIQNCNLKRNSKNLILGDGNIDSPIMIIGEAPTIEDENANKSFQGDAGRLLEKMLSAINIKKQFVYCCYAINFRPPEDRKPTSQEIKRYSVFLKEHISIIDPKIIIILGNTAMEAVISSREKITNERGKWKEIIIKNKLYPLMITFNPSYLIRFPENKKYSWEDLKKIKIKIHQLNIKI